MSTFVCAPRAGRPLVKCGKTKGAAACAELGAGESAGLMDASRLTGHGDHGWLAPRLWITS